MAKTAALAPEFEDAIQNYSQEKRVETLSRLTTLFVEGSSRFSEEHVGLFDAVLGRLIADVEPRARCELSLRLAAVGNAPIEVLRTLARDEIAVAGPLIRNSARLTEADLIAIAKTEGRDHLLALAERAGIGEAITDILVERGDGSVVNSLAGNHAARLSARSFAILAARDDPDGTLAQMINQRPDLPHGLITVRSLADPGAVPQPAPFDETKIRDLAKAGRRGEAIAALAALCSVPAEVVERLMASERTDPMLILCKAAGFGWPSVEAIVALQPKGRTGQSLDMTCANYERLAPATARRVLRFWQARHDDFTCGGT